MENDRKSGVIFRVYQILFEHSSYENPLTQQDILSYLKQEYDIESTRQAVSRHIQTLIDMDIDINTSNKGSYLISRPLDNNELIYLIDSVLGSRHIDGRCSKELINRLIELGGPGFKDNVKYVYVAENLNKTSNKDLFVNIDYVVEAIEKERKIKFNYIKKTSETTTRTMSHIASPYQLILHNQHYYLILRDDNREDIGFYRMDKMVNVKVTKEKAFPLKDNEEFKNGINYEKYSTGMPYLFNDEIKTIIFECPKSFYDQVYDWFGSSVTIIKSTSRNLTCKITSSEDAMLYWTLQYGNNVKIIEPQSLREKVIETLKSTLKMYKQYK